MSFLRGSTSAGLSSNLSSYRVLLVEGKVQVHVYPLFQQDNCTLLHSRSPGRLKIAIPGQSSAPPLFVSSLQQRADWCIRKMQKQENPGKDRENRSSNTDGTDGSCCCCSVIRKRLGKGQVSQNISLTLNHFELISPYMIFLITPF